jgi:hypothetical protein
MEEKEEQCQCSELKPLSYCPECKAIYFENKDGFMEEIDLNDN